MQHCLKKDEIETLIDNNWAVSEEEEYRELHYALSQSRLWENEIIVFSYFLSQILERKIKAGVDCTSIIKQVFEAPPQIWLSIQELDISFIRYMFRHLRNLDLTLEEELIDIQSKMGQHIYE